MGGGGGGEGGEGAEEAAGYKWINWNFTNRAEHIYVSKCQAE